MMEAANVHNKLILAVVQEDDYDTTVSELNQNGFFVTMLSCLLYTSPSPRDA